MTIEERARERKAISELELIRLYENSRFCDFQALEDSILLGESNDTVKTMAYNLARGAAIRRLS